MSSSISSQRFVRIAVAAVVGGGLAYGATLLASRRGPSNGSLGAAEKVAGRPSEGGIGTYVAKATPEPLPDVQFVTAAEAPTSLSEAPVTLAAFRGRVVLLNLWATWCIPCRKEMPALDRLQSALGSKDFEVVALSIDRAGVAGTRKFLDSNGIKALTLYADPTARLANDFKAIGLPTTLLIDRAGREIGRMLGPAEWDSPEALALVGNAIAAK